MQCKINTSNNKSDKEGQFIILSAMEISHSDGLFYTLNISFILEAKQNAIYIYIAPDKI